MLTSSLSLLGPIVLCLVVYLRWQLGGGGADESAPVLFPAVAAASSGAPSACRFEPNASGCAALLRRCVASHTRHPSAPDVEPQRAPDSVRETDRSRMPGVYVDAGGTASETSLDATIRGQLLADRIIHGRFGAGQLRRGKKGALDVIVIGANLFGISATARLMQAGLRVLLVDRHSWALDAPSPAPGAPPPGGARRVRLPLVTGHHVSVVAQRADGMLELQAERAAWYTASVIFASPHAGAVVCEPSEPREPIDENGRATPRAA